MLSAVLREVHGADARLERWDACPLSKRGKQRTVRFDFDARLDGGGETRSFQWVGKFYERENALQRVATILRELATSDCSARGGVVIPRVVACHTPWRLLLLAFETGESVIRAIARHNGLALQAIARALAALHRTPVTLDTIRSPLTVLGDLRQRTAALCARFPGETDSLCNCLGQLERQAPAMPAPPLFLHGDLGPSQLLWQIDRIVLMDFDKSTRGDAAWDLGNLLTQLRRLTLRKPGKLPGFNPLRRGLLEAYQQWSPHDRGLARRVAWYEGITLLRKIHFLASDTSRHNDAETMRQRQAEAMLLLRELPPLVG